MANEKIIKWVLIAIGTLIATKLLTNNEDDKLSGQPPLHNDNVTFLEKLLINKPNIIDTKEDSSYKIQNEKKSLMVKIMG